VLLAELGLAYSGLEGAAEMLFACVFFYISPDAPGGDPPKPLKKYIYIYISNVFAELLIYLLYLYHLFCRKKRVLLIEHVRRFVDDIGLDDV